LTQRGEDSCRHHCHASNCQMRMRGTSTTSYEQAGESSAGWKFGDWGILRFSRGLQTPITIDRVPNSHRRRFEWEGFWPWADPRNMSPRGGALLFNPAPVVAFIADYSPCAFFPGVHTNCSVRSFYLAVSIEPLFSKACRVAHAQEPGGGLAAQQRPHRKMGCGRYRMTRTACPG
jgi:hypothetical protein